MSVNVCQDGSSSFEMYWHRSTSVNTNANEDLDLSICLILFKIFAMICQDLWISNKMSRCVNVLTVSIKTCQDVSRPIKIHQYLPGIQYDACLLPTVQACLRTLPVIYLVHTWPPLPNTILNIAVEWMEGGGAGCAVVIFFFLLYLDSVFRCFKSLFPYSSFSFSFFSVYYFGLADFATIRLSQPYFQFSGVRDQGKNAKAVYNHTWEYAWFSVSRARRRWIDVLRLLFVACKPLKIEVAAAAQGGGDWRSVCL